MCWLCTAPSLPHSPAGFSALNLGKYGNRFTGCQQRARHSTIEPFSAVAVLILFSLFFVSPSLSEMTEDQLACQTSPSNVSAELPVTIKYGDQERRLEGSLFRYTLDPNITFAEPPKSFLRYKDWGLVPSPRLCAMAGRSYSTSGICLLCCTLEKARHKQKGGSMGQS